MGNDRSPESQQNVGDTIIYDAQTQTVFNLGNFKWDHFHSISDENKTQTNISPFTQINANMNAMTIENILFFNKLHLSLLCLVVPK